MTHPTKYIEEIFDGHLMIFYESHGIRLDAAQRHNLRIAFLTGIVTGISHPAAALLELPAEMTEFQSAKEWEPA